MPADLTEPFLQEQRSTGQRQLTTAQRKLLIGTGLCCVFMLTEIAGGIMAHSLAIVTDAAHMLSDVAGFLVGVMSIFLANRLANHQYSFGYHRAEVIGALVSIMIVWVMTGILVYEAIWRLLVPEEVDGCIMFWISFVGILMNAVLMLVLGHGSEGGHGHSHSHGLSHSHHNRGRLVGEADGHEHKHADNDNHEHGHADNDKLRDHEHGHADNGQPDDHEHGHADSGKPHDHEHGHADSGKPHDHEHGHADRGKPHDHEHGDQGGEDNAHDGQDEHGDGHGHDHDHPAQRDESNAHDGQDEHGHGHDHDHDHPAPPTINQHESSKAQPLLAVPVYGHDHDHDDPAPPTVNQRERSKAKPQLAMRAAIVHVIGDILQSVGVCIAAAFIWAFNDRWPDENGVSYWYRLDPVCTLLFSVLVGWTSVGTVKEAMHVLMAGVPEGIHLASISRTLMQIPNVTDVHDLHVWTLSGDKLNLWAHITVVAGADSTPVLYAAQEVARRIDCYHSCFQIEDAGTYDRDACGDMCYTGMPDDCMQDPC